MSDAIFADYSRYYDLLYADKDYVAEADYIAAALKRAGVEKGRLLEFGCGTGRHGALLCEKGHTVHGVEGSSEMAQAAKRNAQAAAGNFSCEVGDIRQVRVGRSFDAVLSLFHVVSYQTTNEDLRAVFTAAAAHLESDGVFLFDVWHGPAVMAQKPAVRVKRVSDGQCRVLRIAEPDWNAERNMVTVNYTMLVEDLSTNQWRSFTESHPMRYLFPQEIELLADGTGFAVERSEAFLTGEAPSQETWGVAYLLRKK